jgi:hypothetical protein
MQKKTRFLKVLILTAAFVLLSTLLELLAMRRGVLTVGKTSGSLIQDLKKLITLKFVSHRPTATNLLPDKNKEAKTCRLQSTVSKSA